MHPEIEALIAMLEEAEALLRKHGIAHWADWLKKDTGFLRNLDFYGIEHLLSAFGGMGSLNDLGFAEPSNDNRNVLVTSGDDSRFQSLLNDIYTLATKLSREEGNVQHRA